MDYYIRDVKQSEETIKNLSLGELVYSNLQCMPKSLFKYYSNRKENTYSLDALKNNTVYLSNPKEFDDPYDCNIYIDGTEFALQRLRYYAELCGVKIDDNWNYEELSIEFAKKLYQYVSSGGSLDELYINRNDCELVHLHNEKFFLTLQIELSSPNADGSSYYNAFNKVINDEYKDIQKSIDRFRVACFAQTPYSMLMWSHYARLHQGFCIEYETPFYSEKNANIYHNLFPVIYTDVRQDLSQLSLNWRANGKPSDSELWDIYKYCLLSKSLDWKYQQEWRLISYDDDITNKNYNCDFFKIKKVYLGNKMQSDDRKEIIEICKSKGIPYTGVIIAPDRFEMKDCNMLCEDCERLKNN